MLQEQYSYFYDEYHFLIHLVALDLKFKKTTQMKKSQHCIDACLACVISCEMSITDCIASGNRECILLCRDCADICALCARFDARKSRFSHDIHLL